ncbi:MAG: DeoR family transcriptional regulator [Atopobiaceae bacterium]|nr:DeoR family transcriptional regulator [Atopobiaceae bacterium]
MLAQERRSRIVELVNTRGAASLAELSQLIGASESTVRRDIEQLSRTGLV